jgi:8-oxo-dGTP pyrophosphatase MutT (NUDIX family)
MREIREEAGYKNTTFIKQLPTQEQLFWAPHKDINRSAEVTVLYFHLIDDDQEEVSQEEHAKHDIKWIKNFEVKNFLNLQNHQIIFDQIKKNDPFIDDGVLVNSGIFN